MSGHIEPESPHTPPRRAPSLLPDTVIWTPEIERLHAFIVDCLEMQLPGAAVAGGQRFGKTFALKYLTSLLATTFPVPMAIVSWSVRGKGENRAVSDGEFLQARLLQTGAIVADSNAVPVLERRLVDGLIDLAAEAGSRYLMIMIDEAQNLTAASFAQLIYIFNALEQSNVKPFVLLTGQPELSQAAEKWKNQKGHQVVGRFFCQIFRFRGIEMGEVEQVLDGFDEVQSDGSRLSASILPHLQGQWSFGKWAPLFVTALDTIAGKQGITGTLTLPMQYLRAALLNLLSYVKRSRIDPRLVTDGMVLQAVKNSGFLLALSYCVEMDDIKTDQRAAILPLDSMRPKEACDASAA